LNRSLAGVDVYVYCSGDERVPLRIKSDENGIARGTYEPASCTPLQVSVAKQGYQSYASGFRGTYVLSRQFTPQEVDRIVALDSVNQLSELRELLAGTSKLENPIFSNETRMRSALRELARDPSVTLEARRLLALIAAREDLRFVLQLPKPPAVKTFPERWRYNLATALVNPESEDEWTFLERCVSNEFNDRWVDSGAIQTLMLTASARSQKILEDAQAKNSLRSGVISRALDYIKSNPEALAGTDLESLGKRTAQALELGTGKTNGAPRFNRSRDKALINMISTSGEFLYTATFHNINGVWILKGAHETGHLMVIRVPLNGFSGTPRKE